MRIITAFAVGLALAAALPAAPAKAQNARSFVSGHGSDANNCSLAAPCRTFAQALTVTNAGGEIDALDPAGYGSMTITKSISIVNDGVGTVGVIVPSGGTGITINAGPSDAVSLRGLSIEGNGSGQTGILFNAGKSLTIENCVIRHVTQDGIGFFPNAATNLTVLNTLVADNGNDGVNAQPSGSGTVAAVFNHVQVINNGANGILMFGANSTGVVNATVDDSIASGNGSTSVGFYVGSTPGHAATTMMISRSLSSNNGYGLYAQNSSSAIIRIANSTVTGNVNGWSTIGGGVVQSYGNNSMDGNMSMEMAPSSMGMK